MRFAQGKLREGSGSTGAEILRFAQDDSQDPSPVRSREAFALNVQAGKRCLAHLVELCYTVTGWRTPR